MNKSWIYQGLGAAQGRAFAILLDRSPLSEWSKAAIALSLLAAWVAVRRRP